MDEKVREIRRMIYEQININTEIEIMRRNQTKSGAEKYSNRNEKFTRGVQQQI